MAKISSRPSCVRIHTAPDRTDRGVNAPTRSYAHTKWPHSEGLSAPAQLHGFRLDVSLYLCRSPSPPRLVIFSHSQPLRVSTDGWRGAEGSRGNWNKKGEGGGASSTFPFLLESKLNPYSALPYADLPRNAPYAQKYTRQYWRQTLTETKY